MTGPEQDPATRILQLAMPTPLKGHFDYLPPVSISAGEMAMLQPGCRVLAPFGRRQLVGILLGISDHSALNATQLKPALAVIDTEPLLSPRQLSLLIWAAEYYHHAIGDVLSNALPALLRQGESLLTTTHWQLTHEGKGLPEGALKRARKQAELLALFQERLQQNTGINAATLPAPFNRSHIKSLIDKRLVEAVERTEYLPAPAARKPQQPPELNDEQRAAVAQVASGSFQTYLLEGITGSGKTEVYLQLIARCLDQGKQALVLVPEIGLTPQTVQRFAARFNRAIAVLHSGLGDRERLLAWQSARASMADIIIGTRSAVFTPLLRPGLIIIDEEHDSSLKQQDGFRYSARDLAIKRAQLEQCPIVLGSATPSLETLHHALRGRYQHLHLRQRATGAELPTSTLLDIRHAALDEGLSEPLLDAIGTALREGNQALVFINRRGFAPVMLCHDCGWVAECDHCDARYTVHFKAQLLRCHHCERQRSIPRQCPQCQSTQIDFYGPGTERVELALKRRLGQWPVIRIDRDTTTRKDSLSQLLEPVNAGDPCLLVGTQLLAKGHHFADVTVVGVLDADGGLFSADFRGPERMGQLLTQVAGRAGREQKAGRVLIQTHQPDHPLWHSLLQQGYADFARQLLAEREQQRMPPFGYIALLRAEGKQQALTETLLRELRSGSDDINHCRALGPLPAPMARRAGWFRSQLLLHSEDRRALHQRVERCIELAERSRLGKKLRWSVDIDPVDMY